jgi:hypothetical protein
MKKIFLMLSLLSACVFAQTTGEFQKVYELPGMTAEQIEKNFGPVVVDVGQDTMSKTQDAMRMSTGSGWLNSLQGGQKTRVRCNISAVSWMPAVNEWVDGDVVLQAREGRARITVTVDKVYGPGKDNCISSIEKYLDAKFSKMKKLGNDW